jgi:hypothetical protein
MKINLSIKSLCKNSQKHYSILNPLSLLSEKIKSMLPPSTFRMEKLLLPTLDLKNICIKDLHAYFSLLKNPKTKINEN